jgi:PEP-CTERM motif
MKNITSRFRIGLMVLFALLASILTTRADSVATVTFANLGANCEDLELMGPCSGSNPVVVWSGTFSVDLQTNTLISSSVTSTGIFGGPWIAGPVLDNCPFDAEPCSIAWRNPAGFNLVWDPGQFDESVVTSQPFDFLLMGEVPDNALSYSVSVTSTPEPPTLLLLGIGLAAMLILRSRRTMPIIE